MYETNACDTSLIQNWHAFGVDKYKAIKLHVNIHNYHACNCISLDKHGKVFEDEGKFLKPKL